MRFRVEDDDVECQEPSVRLGLFSTDASGDPQESRSTSSGSRASLTVTDVAADVRATVSVAYPNCRPPSPGCGSFHELQPK